jgi:hypothetical protein
VIAAVTAVVGDLTGPLDAAYNAAIYLVLPHGAVLVGMLYRYRQRYEKPGRIDGLIGVALGYIIWFGLVPLLALW